MKKIPSIYKTALLAAVAGADAIMKVYQRSFETTIKPDGSPVTEADQISSAIIAQHLMTTQIPIVGEERDKIDYSIRKNYTQNWCVDPLDGTKEFIKRNDEFAVNIALIEKQVAVFGLIASPVEQKIIFGGKKLGVFLWDYKNDFEMKQLKTVKRKSWDGVKLTWIGSRSHHMDYSSFFDEINEKFESLEQICKGSALKFFDLTVGKVELYPRFAPTMEWDIAAGHAIINELGGTIVDATTHEELKYNKESLFNPHFICKTSAYLDVEKTMTNTTKV
ncbi:MAG: 3'(2'), 5'-bisphosphate nucleotidase [Psychromonas sp.]|jgi:3'(2'), 5'-bisphosphate nucleotidase